MTEFTFKYDGRTLADHKRSYGIQRRNLETGKKTKMERYSFNEFPTFEAYQQNLEVAVAGTLDPRLKALAPDFKKNLVLHIYGNGDYETLAQYVGMSKGNMHLAFKLSYLKNTFYYLYDDDHPVIADFTETIDHEIRHYKDRRFLNYSARVNNSINDQTQAESYNERTQPIANNYLRMLRTEGFAMFDGKINEWPFGTLALEFELKFHTEAAAKGLQILDSAPEIKSYQWLGAKKAIGFNAYTQGESMFRVIGVSESMRARNIEPTRPADLTWKKEFKNANLATDLPTYRATLEKIAAIPTYAGFIDYYNSAAQMLRLDESEIVLTSAIAKRMVDMETKAQELLNPKDPTVFLMTLLQQSRQQPNPQKMAV